jgi:hypothetical protein
MGATATFTLVQLTRLGEACEAAESGAFPTWRKERAKIAAQYAKDGWLVPCALGYLDEVVEANLSSSAHDEAAARIAEALDCQCFVLEAAHRAAHYDDLDLANFDREDLQAHYEELNGESTPGIGAHVLDAIRALREALSKVDDTQVVVVTIG